MATNLKFSRFRQTHVLFMILFALFCKFISLMKLRRTMISIFYCIRIVLCATEDANEIKGNFLFLSIMTI
jgi:hypothetical protein